MSTDPHEVPIAHLMLALAALSDEQLHYVITQMHTVSTYFNPDRPRLQAVMLAVSALAASVRDARRLEPIPEPVPGLLDLTAYLDDTGHTWGDR